MRITMVRDDNLVLVDGVGLIVDLSDMPADLHAVQWYGDAGHVERQGMMNQPINSLADFQKWISRWNAAAAAAANPPEPAPPPSVPQSVTRFQARAALYKSGMLAAVEAYMALETTDPLTRMAWADVLSFERQSAMVLAVSAALGLSDAQLDDLFVLAATIN